MALLKYLNDAALASIRPEGGTEAEVALVVRCGVQISARNQLTGVIASIEDGAVMSIVVIRLPGGEEVVSSITKGSVDRLQLEVGQVATAIIKSTDVIIAVD